MSKSNIAVGIIAIASLIISIYGLVGGNANQHVTKGVTNFGSITLDDSSSVATSSLKSVGCIQGFATSTASPIVLTYTSSFTSTSTFPTGTVINNGGLVAWKFGSCQ